MQHPNATKPSCITREHTWKEKDNKAATTKLLINICMYRRVLHVWLWWTAWHALTIAQYLLTCARRRRQQTCFMLGLSFFRPLPNAWPLIQLLNNSKQIWDPSLLLFRPVLLFVCGGWVGETNKNCKPWSKKDTTKKNMKHILHVGYSYTHGFVLMSCSRLQDQKGVHSWGWNQTSVHNLTFVLAVTMPQSIN